MYTFDEIQAVDSEIAEAIQLEKGRQNHNIFCPDNLLRIYWSEGFPLLP